MRISNIVLAFAATLVSANAAPTAAPSTSSYPSGSPSNTPSATPEEMTTFDIEVLNNVTAAMLETATETMIKGLFTVSRRLEPSSYAAAAPAVTVVATLIDCATLDTTTAATSVCYCVASTVTASPSSGVVPSVIVATLDANVLSGAAATDLTSNGVTPLFLNLPPSAEPSSAPSQSSSPTGSPSGMPSISHAPSVNCENEESFSISDGRFKTCDWVAAANTDRRCNKFDYLTNKPIFEICPLVCNPACASGRSAAPTFAPTTSFEPSYSPTHSAPTICKDKKNFEYKGNTCDWVAENPDKRCKKKIKRIKKKKTIKKSYKTYCKGACNPRCSCKNTKKPIKFKDTTTWTKCYKISIKNCNKSIAFRAGGRMKPAYEVCAKRCGACYFD